LFKKKKVLPGKQNIVNILRIGRQEKWGNVGKCDNERRSKNKKRKKKRNSLRRRERGRKYSSY